MPIFKKKNNTIIFIHIPKNAGKSIECFLTKNKFNYKLGSRSFLNKALLYFFRKTSNSDAKKFLHGQLDYAFTAQHLTYVEMDLLGVFQNKSLSNIKTFAVVRNPYTRIISTLTHFQWLILPILGKDKFETQEDVCDGIKIWFNYETFNHNLLAHRRSQSDYVLGLDGNIRSDFILKYENLNSELYSLCDELDIEKKPILNLRKGKYKDTGFPQLNNEARELVYKKYEKDFHLFNYK